MGKQKKCNLGVFVNTNWGEVIDCHGKISWERQNSNYLFCADNRGTITNEESKREEVVSEKECQISVKESEPNQTIIEIHSIEQFLEIVRQINLGDSFYYKGNYKLLEDLDLQGMKWTPIGYSEQHPFSGTFDGNGHSVKNVLIHGSYKSCVGFFGCLKNAKIHHVSIEGTMKGGRYTGSLAGVSSDSCIQACFSSAKVIGSHCVGGFVAENRGRIAHCYFSGIVQHRRVILSRINDINVATNNLCY